jgi:hypothetical protein
MSLSGENPMMLLVALLGEALADTITLDSGEALEGTLTHYEIRGSCNIHVDSGGLAGADVVLPCAQVVRMERQAVVQMGPTTINGSVIEGPADQVPVEEIAEPLVTLAPMAVAEDLAPAEEVGVEPEAAPQEPLPPAAAPEEQTPVAAVSPDEPAVAAVSPEEPAPADEPEATADASPEEPAKAEAEPTPKNGGVFDKFNWPKIRIDR